MYTTQPQRYPSSIDVVTPTGTKSIEWKALCVQLGVAKARALLKSWERAKTTKRKTHPESISRCTNREWISSKVGVLVQSPVYGCMDYWEVTNVCYRGSLVNTPAPRTKPVVEAAWSTLKTALFYKLF